MSRGQLLGEASPTSPSFHFRFPLRQADGASVPLLCMQEGPGLAYVPEVKVKVGEHITLPFIFKHHCTVLFDSGDDCVAHRQCRVNFILSASGVYNVQITVL